jgi:hypothetical protein
VSGAKTPASAVETEMDPVRAQFDAARYLAEQPDVAAAGADPWEHYISSGWREGRDPTDWFQIAGYLAANPDVAAAGLEPFRHYVLHGRDEGRSLAPGAPIETAPAPHGLDSGPVLAEFDADFYVAANPGLGLTPKEALAHYLETGWRALRDPARWFSTRRYLQANADVVETGMNPFVHYVLHGRREGRDLEHGLGFRYDLIQAAAGFEDHVQALVRNIPDREASPTGDLEAMLSAIAADRPVHLTVSHDDFTASLGGVQLCLKIEGAAMRAAGAVHVHLFPGRASPVIDLEREHPRMGVLVDGALAGFFDAAVVSDALAGFCSGRPVTLAIHSVIAHRVADLIAITGRLDISQAFYWLHDFSSLCSNYALMRNDAVFCGAPPPQSLACEICVYGARRQVHLAEHVALFEAVDPVVVAPSEAALALWRSRFPFRERRGVVHTHAVFAPIKAPRSKATTSGDESADRPLRVGFLGMATNHKGWPVYSQLVRRFTGDPRYSFHHLAKETDDGVPTQWTSVGPTEDDPAPMISAVRDLELDVALIWSLWPETFCFAAYEAVAGGAAIVTNPDSGNVHDLIRQLNCGMVIEDDTVLNELFASGEVLALARANRVVRPQTLVYSRMTADLILGPTA